jgi:hypothetical protein
MLLGVFLNDSMAEQLEKLKNQDLPVKTSFKLAKTLKKMDEEKKHFEEEKLKLLKKYGEEIEDNPGSYSVGTDNKEFYEKLEELCNIKVDIEKIKIEDLGDIKLSTNTLLFLDFLIE